MDLKSIMNPNVLNIPPYTPGKNISEVSAQNGGIQMHKLSSNENPIGPSPRGMEALAASLRKGNVYPDARCTRLRQKLAEQFCLAPENFAVGTGSAALLEATARIFLTPGEENQAIMFQPSFGLYRSRTLLYGGIPVVLPIDEAEDYRMDLSRVLAAITPKTRIIWLCSPNNPTGNYIPYGELTAFLDKVPEHVAVYVDEAYIEYSDKPDCKTLIPLVDRYNLIVARTFSKIFGLGAIRIGYAVAKAEIAALLAENTIVFSVGTGPQAAAMAALEDTAFLTQCYDENREGRAYLTEELTKLGMHVIPSQSNFLFVNPRMDTRQFTEELEKKGYIVRGNFVYPRITIGTMEENRGMAAAIREILQSHSR